MEPCCSDSTRASSFTIGFHLKAAAHPDDRALRSGVHVHGIHERPHQTLAEPAASCGSPRSGRRSPAPKVSDGDFDRSIGQDEAHFEKAILRTICVLDRVRERFPTGHEDVVHDPGIGIDLSEPPANGLAQRGENMRFRWKAKEQWFGCEWNLPECK